MTTKQEALYYLKENYPLVKIVDFDTLNKLFYDARAHMIFVVGNEDLPFIADYLRTHDKAFLNKEYPHFSGIDSIIERIEDLQSKGVLLPGPVEQLISTEPHDVNKRIEYNMENILMRKFVLETTQQCNFRCRYCHNTLEPVYRHHTKSQMTFAVAKAAIDFYKNMYLKFYRRLPDDKKELLLKHFKPFVGFYGGEPSLNWNLVKEASDYFLNCGWENDGINQRDLEISINTNLYILTDDMMSFVMSYEPLLFVSLDGPKEDNDRNRITSDGKGTFDKVYSNLMRIKAADEKYFKEKMLILCVEAEGNDSKAVHNLLDNLGCPISYLKEQPFGCLEREPKKQIQYYDEYEEHMINTIIEKYKNRASENDPNAIEEFSSLYFLEGVENDTPYHRRPISISLTCPLCVDNIMIGTKGEMHLCHKTDGSLPLGNVCEGGYDMKKMFEAYQSYGEATNCIECRSCWAMNVCSYCAALRLDGGKWVNPNHEECDLQRRRFEYLLKLFVATYKLDPTILPKLMERKKDLNIYKSIVDFNSFVNL